MSSKETAEDTGAEVFQKVSRYLSSISGLKEFVIAAEGLPIVWSEGLNQERAEELVALATDATQSIARFKEWVDPKSLVVTATSSGRNISMLSFKEFIVVAEGKPGVVEQALRKVLDFWAGVKTSCPYCGNDLTLSVIKCPKCGAHVPFGLERCPNCEASLKIIKCPHCGSFITPKARKLVLRRSPWALKLGIGLWVTAAAVSAALVALGGSRALVPAIISGVVLGITGAVVVSSKELVEG